MSYPARAEGLVNRINLSVNNIRRIHSTWGHSDISAITLVILSQGRCSCLNIYRYIAPVDMMTFRWSCRSYQSICQQHPLYSQHLWAWWHFGNRLVEIIPGRMQLSQHLLIHSTRGHDDISVITPALSVYLLKTSAVFTPTGHVNTLQVPELSKYKITAQHVNHYATVTSTTRGSLIHSRNNDSVFLLLTII